MQKQESNEVKNGSAGVGLLGEWLKEKRTEKNYSLEKLSQKTKISVNILKSLESNDYKNLPSAAYIKGFVRNYTKVLNLPLDEAINKMEYTYLNVLGKPFPSLNHTKQFDTTKDKNPFSRENEPAPQDVIESGDSLIESTKSILPIIIFAGVVLLFVGGYKIVSSVVESEVSGQKVKDLGPKIESSSALSKESTKKEEPEVESSTEAVETAATEDDVEEEPVQVPAATPEISVKAKPELQRNFPVVEFRPIRGKLFSVKTDAPENSDPSILPESIKSKVNLDLQNVYIKAIDGNTWLSYKIDNRPIVSAIINKGSDLFLQGEEIRVFLGNVNVTKIFYNNFLIDTPTRSGVKSLIFPEESNSKYMLPLFPKANDDILYTGEEYRKRMNLEEEELKRRQQ